MDNNCLTKQNNRVVWIDLLRILSAFAVVVIHICLDLPVWTEGLIDNPNWMLLNIFDNLSRFSVPVFMMISGSFFLDENRELDIKTLYTKKIKRIIIAFAFWTIVYAVLKFPFIHDKMSAYDFIMFIISGSEIHLWYIWACIFLYMISPLLRCFNKTKKTEEYFLLLCSIIMILNFLQSFLILPSFVDLILESADVGFITGFSFYFVVGHYITKYEICKKARIVIYISAIVSVALSAFLTYYKYVKYQNGNNIMDNVNINVAVEGVAVFLAAKYGFPKLKISSKTESRIVNVASLTFGIFLIHMIFVDLIDVLKYFNITFLRDISAVISVPLCSLIVFILSAAAVFIIKKIPVLKKYIV